MQLLQIMRLITSACLPSITSAENVDQLVHVDKAGSIEAFCQAKSIGSKFNTSRATFQSVSAWSA